MTSDLAAQFETVVLKDLSVKAMTASAKGTAETPGKRVAQKAGLNRAILPTGWGELRAMFEYKAGTTITVNPAYTSQACSRCGHVAAENRRSQALFQCVACGFEDDADCNSATNVLSAGVSPVTAGGRPRRPDGDARGPGDGAPSCARAAADSHGRTARASDAFTTALRPADADAGHDAA